MGKIALTNARIIDGTGCSPVENGVVIIDGTMLEAVGPAESVIVPEGCRKIDIKGNTLLPSLIDGHMHVSGEPGRLDHMGHVKSNLSAAGMLQECLQWGTGTVAHAAGSPENVVLSGLIESGRIRGCSNLLVSGAVTPTCGHVRGRSADGPWEIRKAVREMIAAGVDFIKTCASGGFQWEHEKLTHEDYTPEELKVLVEQSHSREKRVHVHAHAQPGLGNAISAGCDVILHGVLIDDAALEGIAERKLWYMPTLHVTSEKFWGRPGIPAYMSERMKETNPFHREGVRKAFKMGIRIVVGTDGVPGSVMNELYELTGCGLTPMDAIAAATSATADALDILERTGTLEAGKTADIIAVRGNPLKDISVLGKIESVLMVMKSGEIYRDILDTLPSQMAG